MAPDTLPSSIADPDAWRQAVYAFLVEKGARSGSRRTVEGYARMLWPFLERHGPPDRVTSADVLAFAHGIGASGRVPSPTTVGARIACVSSLFRFLIRMAMLGANPCDALERPKARPPVARGLGPDEVRRLLAVVPDTVAGRRDRAMLLTFLLTGRRRSEVLAMAAGDLTLGDGITLYAYRGKGGVRGRRELPAPAVSAIERSLADVGRHLATMDPSESLWQAGAGPSGISSATCYARFRGYLGVAGLPPSGLHVLRHTAAKLRRDAGETVESVSAFLDHSSLAVTTVYLRRLEGVEDRSWHEVAASIGA